MKHKLLGFLVGPLLTGSGLAQAETLLVSLEKDNAVAVLDVAKRNAVKTAAVGRYPWRVAVKA